MKLAHPEITKIFDFDDCKIQTISVESPRFFYDLIMDIKLQQEGMDGKAILSIKDKPVSMKKYLDLLSDVVSFDINTSSLIKKVVGEADKISADELHFEKTQSILSQIESYVSDILLTFDSDFYCDNISFLAILKACGIKIDVAGQTLGELIFSYMQLVREFDNDKLFVIINLRSYISMDEFKLFVQTLSAHDFHVLLLENRVYSTVDGEQRLIIDEDLCEI